MLRRASGSAGAAAQRAVGGASTEVLHTALAVPPLAELRRLCPLDERRPTTGNVRINLRHAFVAAGTAANVADVDDGQVVAAGEQYVVMETRLATLAAPPVSSTLRVNFRRLGADAADTLAADIGSLGLVPRRTA